MGATINPPAYPGAEIEEGGAEIVMATIFGFYLFSTTIIGPHSQLGYEPTRPPELKQLAGKTYHRFAMLTFSDLAVCGCKG